MKHRISSRISALALAGLLAVVPVAGAVAVAQPAAAATTDTASEQGIDRSHLARTPLVDEDGDGYEDIVPISEDVEIAPISAELDEGFPWIFAASLTGGLVVAVAAMIIMHRNDKAATTRARSNR